jgi:hypothetical protein
LALVVWTLFVWTTRISNIWRDDSLDATARVGATALAGSFTVLALVMAVSGLRGAAGWFRRSLVVLAGWTVAVWVVRSVAILIAGWSIGFKAGPRLARIHLDAFGGAGSPERQSSELRSRSYPQESYEPLTDQCRSVHYVDELEGISVFVGS